MEYPVIPSIAFPHIEDYEIDVKDEKLVPLSETSLVVNSKYYEKGIVGSLKDVWVRESLVLMLLKADECLPDGLRLKVWDGYRPLGVQRLLWDLYRADVIRENPGLTTQGVDKLTVFYVSRPSRDINHPSLHNTGGAVDVTLVTDNGYEINMGTPFDGFGHNAWTNHFEKYAVDKEIQNNRRILYYAMTQAGFTNLPSEWWHYDYGNKFWAYFNDCPALYTGILDDGLPDKFVVIGKCLP